MSYCVAFHRENCLSMCIEMSIEMYNLLKYEAKWNLELYIICIYLLSHFVYLVHSFLIQSNIYTKSFMCNFAMMDRDWLTLSFSKNVEQISTVHTHYRRFKRHCSILSISNIVLVLLLLLLWLFVIVGFRYFIRLPLCIF